MHDSQGVVEWVHMTYLNEACEVDGPMNESKDLLYSKYIDELWRLSHHLEDKLSPVMKCTGPEEDKPSPDIRLHAELDKLVDRYRALVSRIEI